MSGYDYSQDSNSFCRQCNEYFDENGLCSCTRPKPKTSEQRNIHPAVLLGLAAVLILTFFFICRCSNDTVLTDPELPARIVFCGTILPATTDWHAVGSGEVQVQCKGDTGYTRFFEVGSDFNFWITMSHGNGWYEDGLFAGYALGEDLPLRAEARNGGGSQDTLVVLREINEIKFFLK